MQDVFEKIIEKLEEQKTKGIYDSNSIIGEKNVWAKAIEIVKQEAEKIGTDTNVGSNGWIPVSERLPEEPKEGLTNLDECDEYIVMIKNAKIPTALNYAGNGEWYRDGVFYDVIAWQPLPEPYQPKGE